MTKPRPPKWPKGSRQARDFALMELTSARDDLYAILAHPCSREDEYRAIGRAIMRLGRARDILTEVQPEA